MLSFDIVCPECIYCTLVGLAVAVFTLMACVYVWREHRVLSAAYRLPSVTSTVPLLGHAHLILHGVTDMVNILMNKSAELYASTSQGWLSYGWGFIRSSKYWHQVILNSEKNLDKGPTADVLKIFLGNGLLIAPGPIWKTTRRHLNPLFYPRNLKLLVPRMNQCGRDLVIGMCRYVGQGHVDVNADVAGAVFRSAASLVFGPVANVNVNYGTDEGMLHSLDRIHQIVYSRYMKIWLWPDVLFRFLYRKELSDIDKHLRTFIERHIKVNIKKDGKKMSYDPPDGSEVKSTLDCDNDISRQLSLPEVYEIMTLKYPEFREEDLKNEIASMLTGGTESSKVVLSSALLALAANPHIQDKLHSEIMSVVGSHNEDVTLEHLKIMCYLDQVIKETLRKFPITPMIPRKLEEDTQLGGCVLPAGATVYCNIAAVHADPRTYPDPQRFDPERFTEDNSRSRQPHTYIPFGGGLRMCIGKQYSLLVVKIIIVHIIRRFELSTQMDINNMKYIPGAVYVSSNGYRMKINSRR